eukprot:TRINITY_DN9_c0_g2_i3.p1 TRINITY_DN9_c0_g2~~TRINITY_DN9_c0_g2_i3.p1  ORF type:complete len:916 (+),score=299.04 TRINITY_DN9_c0_g2_i3:109-2856(+)
MAADNTAIDSLLKEFELRDAAEAAAAAADEAAPAPAGHSDKPAERSPVREGRSAMQRCMGGSSIAFSTYEPQRGGYTDANGEGLDADGVSRPDPAATRRALPKALEPMHLGARGGGVDPWGCQTRSTLPGLGGASGQPSANPSPSQSPAKAALEAIHPRSDVAVRCLAVKAGIVPMQRWGHCSAVVGGSLYIFGGMRSTKGDDYEAANDFHEFNVDTHAWCPCFAALGQAPSARHSACMAVHGDSVYVYGGVAANNGLCNDVHEYNTDTQEWVAHEAAAEKPHPPSRGEASMVMHGRRLVVFGGRVTKEVKGRPKLCYSNDVWTFDTRHNKWKHVKQEKDAPEPGKRAGHAACVMNGKMYICGGADTSEQYSDLWRFDLATHVWEEVPSGHGAQRHGHTLAAVGDTLFAYGGVKERDGALLQWIKPELPVPPGATAVWSTANVSGATAGAYMVSGGGGLRQGQLVLFGGKVRNGVESSSAVLSMLLASDVIVEEAPIGAAMGKLLRKAQLRPQEWGADLKITVNGRAKYAHAAYLQARCSALHAALLSCCDDSRRSAVTPEGGRSASAAVRECVLDGNKRRKGLPSIKTSETLHAILQFYYAGRLSSADYEDADALKAVANELKLADLADFLATLDPPSKMAGLVGGARGLRKLGGNDNSDGHSPPAVAGGSGLASRAAKAEAAAEPVYRAMLSDLFTSAATRGVPDALVSSDLPSSPHIPCHTAVLTAHSPVLRRALTAPHPHKATKAQPFTLAWQLDEASNVPVAHIVLNDLPSSAIEHALEYMYTGKCDATLTSAAGLMATANVLKLPVLRTLCERAIWRQMEDQDLDALCGLVGIADRYKGLQLKDKAISVLAASPAAVVKEVGSFAGLDAALQAEVLQACEESSMRVRAAMPGTAVQKPAHLYQARMNAQ